MGQTKTPRRSSKSRFWLAAAMLLVALLPRLWQLGRFITPDEILFLDHARQFLLGLNQWDLPLTLGIGYPGVTVAWVGALGLLGLFGLSSLGFGPLPAQGASLEQFLAGADLFPLPYYVAGRIATVFLVTALLVLCYWLAGLLFSQRAGANRTKTPTPRQGLTVALLGFLLLALDPFMLGYSRLMHIAVPLALLLLLAVMSWLLWLRDGGVRYLVLTGLFSGLALLTKSTALLLFPVLIGLLGMDWLIDRFTHRRRAPGAGRRLLHGLLGWLVVSALAAFLLWALWPAMWQDPATVLSLSFGKLWVDKQAGQGNLGMFWMGKFVEDPGLAFYPVALLLKVSPLVALGLTVNIIALVSAAVGRSAFGRRENPERATNRPASSFLDTHRTELALWAYALVYLIVMTVASKKSVRYLLPAYAAFVPLAALGLLRLKDWILCRWPVLKTRRTLLVLILSFLLLAFALPYAPYYFSYYNPTLLGWLWAPKAILVGWGEGLDQAARYLNSQPGSDQTTVSAWYQRSFAPYFNGETVPLSGEDAIKSNYAVFYVNQTQRDIPDPNLVSYFQRRQPLHVVRLNGIEYAWVYPPVASHHSLPPGATAVGIPMSDRVILEGYSTHPAPSPELGLVVTLYWRALESDLPDYFVYTRAIDQNNQVLTKADSPPVMGFWPSSNWESGQLIADEQLLARPPDAPPGVYRLEVGMYDPVTWEVLEPVSGQRGDGGGIILGEISLP